MGHGSALCAKFHERIFKQFENHISQCKIAANLGLSPYQPNEKEVYSSVLLVYFF